MNDIEELSDRITESGVILSLVKLNSEKLGALSCDLNGVSVIAIDEKKFYDNAGIKTALLHENAHCQTGTFYNERTPKLVRAKLEYRADRHVAENYIKKSDIQKAHRDKGLTEIWEFAEHFNITIEYMKRIFYIHYRMEFLN